MMAAAAHAWDAAAEAWDRHAPMLGNWLRESTTALLDAAGVVPGAQVLDIAAGAGDQTLDIARRVGNTGRVLATDISPRILELARAKLNHADFDDVQTVVADAQALGAAGIGSTHADFDAAVCRLGLMLCERPASALAGVLAALKPGGRFSALVFSEPQRNPCVAIMVSTALRHAGRPVPTSAFEPGSLMSLGRPGLLGELLAAAGFANISVRAMPAPMRLPSVRHYVEFVQTAGLPVTVLLAPLSAAARKAAWQDIEQQLSRFDTGSEWVGPNELLLCSATRPNVTGGERPTTAIGPGTESKKGE